jgi:hypothetical protein
MDVKILAGSHVNSRTTSVLSVDASSKAKAMLPCAQINALLNSGELAGSITSSSLAKNALPNSFETNTENQPAGNFVPSRVLRVEPTGNVALVYNLTVDNAHEYIANGVLVSNCDASIYSHRSSYQYRYHPADDAPIAGSRAMYAREAAELEDEADEMAGDRRPWARRNY